MSGRPADLFAPDRLLAFSDGVFGVAVTLLVIDLRLPPLPPGDADSALLQALRDMAPNLFVFAFTFLVLGMIWLAHHRKFSVIDRVDQRVLWLNLLFLMALCLVPFASSALAEHGGGGRFAFVLYCGVMAWTEVLSAALSAYALREPFVATRSPLHSGARRDMILSPLFTAVVFVAGAAMALGGLGRLAHLSLLLIVPAMALLGRGGRAAPRATERLAR